MHDITQSVHEYLAADLRRKREDELLAAMADDQAKREELRELYRALKEQYGTPQSTVNSIIARLRTIPITSVLGPHNQEALRDADNLLEAVVYWLMAEAYRPEQLLRGGRLRNSW